MSSEYFQMLTSFLYQKNLLSDELKNALLEFENSIGVGNELQGTPRVYVPVPDRKNAQIDE
jgi:hypothetical protein